MNSCYQSCEFSLRKFCGLKFQNFVHRKKMSIFRKFASKKNSKRVIGESSDNDLHTRRRAEVRPCEWPHNPFMEGAGILQEFAKYAANAGLTDFIAAECEQYHLLTNSFVRSLSFLPRNNPPEVQFNLYAETRQIPLTEFCEICMIPSDGSLVEPRPAEFDGFYRTLTVGDERGVSSVTATSLHFPVVHYFVLFIVKCLLAREKVGALSAPDFDVLRRALYGDNTYSLGAIMARRLHINKSKGKIYGGIYATRLASHFNIQIRQHDYLLSKVYLDRQAMALHHFIDGENTTIDIPYNLVFSENTRDIIPLPAPALFDPIAIGHCRLPEQ